MTELLEKQTELPVSAGEDDVRLFLREIREFPRLTLEQERELAAAVRKGTKMPSAIWSVPTCGWWYPLPGNMRDGV